MLASLSFDSAKGLKNFDAILHSLFKNRDHDEAVSYLKMWLSRQRPQVSRGKDIVEVLNSTYREIAQDAKIRSRLITEWIVSDQCGVLLGAEALLYYFQLNKVSDVTFCASIVANLNKTGLILLIKRMLGVVECGDQMLSLALSILEARHSDDTAAQLVEEILINQIGKNFPHATAECMKT